MATLQLSSRSASSSNRSASDASTSNGSAKAGPAATPIARERTRAGPYRVLIVDRHPIVRLGIRASLEASGRSDEFKIVGEAGNADDAIELARQLRPDVVLLEIALDGPRNGLDVARHMREFSDNLRIMILTSYASSAYVQAMIDAGIDGYLLKETPPRDIVDSVRSVLSARQVFSARLVQGNSSGMGGRQASSRLTRKQLDVLQRCAEGHLNEEIAAALGISVKAVQVHLSGIYSRLGARTRTEAVVLAVREGLVAIDYN